MSKLCFGKTSNHLYRFSRYRVCHVVIVLLLTVPSRAAESDNAGQPERMVVVGDVHGDYPQLMEVLQLAKVINAEGEWIAGNTHLVQMGDLPDRGNSTNKVVQFLRNLEKEASSKSGKVDVLIGNHDAMNVYGDLRYVTRMEYEEFADQHSVERLNKLYQNEIEWIRKNIPEQDWPAFDEDYREKWFKQRPPGFYEHRISWQADGEIGKWVLSRDAVLKLGKYLFVHGGIGPSYANHTIEQLNNLVKDGLINIRSSQATILDDEDGPLWYRGLAIHPEAEELPHLENLLSNFEVEHIILGHTVTRGVILPRFDGKVLLTDVGLSNYYGASTACLVIEQEQLFALYPGKQVPIPVGEGEPGILKYLTEVQGIYPDNSYIRQLMEALNTVPANRE